MFTIDTRQHYLVLDGNRRASCNLVLNNRQDRPVHFKFANFSVGGQPRASTCPPEKPLLPRETVVFRIGVQLTPKQNAVLDTATTYPMIFMHNFDVVSWTEGLTAQLSQNIKCYVVVPSAVHTPSTLATELHSMLRLQF